MTRLVRALIVAAAVVAVLVAALLLLVLPVRASHNTPVGAVSVSCGNAFASTPVIGCSDAQSTRQTWSFALLAVGAVGVVGGLAVRRAPARR